MNNQIHDVALGAGGFFRHRLLRVGQTDQWDPWQTDENTLIKEGLIDWLWTYFGSGTKPSGFWLAPFAGDVIPGDTWTGANFAANATEFTDYSSANRLVWTPPGSIPTVASISNAAALTAATMTFNGNSSNSYTLHGITMLTNGTKGGTSGKAVAGTRFATPVTAQGGWKLAFEYGTSLTDNS